MPDFQAFAACLAVSRAEKLKVVVGASSATPVMLSFLFQTISKIKVEKQYINLPSTTTADILVIILYSCIHIKYQITVGGRL